MVIVDALNVLHAAAKAGLGRLDRTRLAELIAVGRWASDHVVLVLDGSGGTRAPGRDSLRRSEEAALGLEARDSGVSEVFAQAGADGGAARDADSVIESILEHEERLGRGRRATVVSSDKRVRGAATAARATVLSSEEFLRHLAEDVRKAHTRQQRKDGGRPDFATDEGADPGRTEYWLRQFGLMGAGPPAGATGGPQPATPPASRPGASDRPGEECGGAIPPDDLDMDRILRQHPPNPTRDDDTPPDRPPRRPNRRR